MLYRKRLLGVLPGIFDEFTLKPYDFRRLHISDINALYDLIIAQDPEDMKYFSPHAFDLASLQKQTSNRAFLMMGTFHKGKLVGYFFLRFFSNRKCFVGRLIDSEYRGKGIGRVMNNIMYGTAWSIRFRCLSTISKNNHAVVRAHKKNQAMIVLKELKDDYLLVEFVRNNEKGI